LRERLDEGLDLLLEAFKLVYQSQRPKDSKGPQTLELGHARYQNYPARYYHCEVEPVPPVPEVGLLVQDKSVSKDLAQALNGEKDR